MTKPLLIPAGDETIGKWEGRVVLHWFDGNIEQSVLRGSKVWSDDACQWISVEDNDDLTVYLDLRYLEVQDHLGRVWWDRSHVWLGGHHLASTGITLHASITVVARQVPTFDELGRPRNGAIVPALADLPPNDPVAWAMWEYWRSEKA